jgi:hypothetical protein
MRLRCDAHRDLVIIGGLAEANAVARASMFQVAMKGTYLARH